MVYVITMNSLSLLRVVTILLAATVVICINSLQFSTTTVSRYSRTRKSPSAFVVSRLHQQPHSPHSSRRLILQQQQQAPLRSSSLASSSNDDDDSDKKVVQISKLDDYQIVDMIEVSFIHACLQLSQGYVDILKLFIVACKAAFERRINVQDLIYKVNHLANQNTAGRELIQEEVTLRATWIQAIYLMLAYIKYQNITTLNQVGKDLDQDVLSRYSNVLPIIVKYRETCKSHAHVITLAETLSKEQELNVMDQAVMTQTLRVFWYILVVLSEEAMADPSAPPRPNIPGTY